MSYYTNYHLTSDSYIGETEVGEWLGFEPWGGDWKWYDHEKDMKNFSNLHPDFVFDLYGKGEEFPDIWHKYFKNGKLQKCPLIVAFDHFDEEKLS